MQHHLHRLVPGDHRELCVDFTGRRSGEQSVNNLLFHLFTNEEFPLMLSRPCLTPLSAPLVACSCFPLCTSSIPIWLLLGATGGRRGEPLPQARQTAAINESTVVK